VVDLVAGLRMSKTGAHACEVPHNPRGKINSGEAAQEIWSTAPDQCQPNSMEMTTRDTLTSHKWRPLRTIYDWLRGRSPEDSMFEAAFEEHIAPIADYYVCTEIASYAAGIKRCKSMDIMWLEYEADHRIAVTLCLGGPHLGYLNQRAANEIYRGSSEEFRWVAIFKRASTLTNRVSLILVRIKIESQNDSLGDIASLP
jgi:hypothetical protein